MESIRGLIRSVTHAGRARTFSLLTCHALGRVELLCETEGKTDWERRFGDAALYHDVIVTGEWREKPSHLVKPDYADRWFVVDHVDLVSTQAVHYWANRRHGNRW